METKAFIKKTILLVDDDSLILTYLKDYLTSLGFDVTICNSGLEAQNIVNFKTFDAVITDLRMNNSRVDGLALMSFIKAVNPQPVILMTGFSFLSETERADKDGAAGFLAKPFKKEELLDILKNILKVEHFQPPSEPIEEQFCKISIDDFISGRLIQSNIFVKVSPYKYIKIAHQGEDLDLDRIRAYKNKNLKYLYLKKDDFYKYMKFSLHLSQVAKSNSAIPMEKKRNLVRHTGELIMEHIFNKDLDKESFDDAKTVVESTVDFLSESDDTFELISTLNNHADFIYAHSLAVSIYANLLAKKMKFSSPQLLYKLSIAGIMHDIGNKEIPREILSKKRTALSLAEVQKIETHSERGMEILSLVRTIPSDVIQIVHHHHEKDSGNGYPLGINKNKIHPLARIIAFVDEFAELVIKAPNNPDPLTLSQAVSHMEMMHKNSFDAVFFTALKEVISGK